jgi:hypothetical protein
MKYFFRRGVHRSPNEEFQHGIPLGSAADTAAAKRLEDFRLQAHCLDKIEI